ncbi:alpha/beta hydrolase [Flavobacterium selenitireducens]|uniref:alpha/beta hydrolase n=1 Tax=Flavobacterium selenitireducens TaxID=2722704 RepID=UPI00168A5248|nr:alpha/beta hydrolase [Flavobacterium selenitireducens]MBD3582097.1 alpha/beta hydrolase fold domain-containing protein [Flavobacterium selenitireducens]
MKKILLLLLFSSVLSAQKMQTLTYFRNDTLQLDLDLYLPNKKTFEKLPLMIFVHGGGFSGGERQNNAAFCKFLSERGFAAATITYTLYMKGKNFSCDGVLSEKIKAIRFGVNDLWLATSYFLKNKEKFNIDSNHIFISGSSAGGEAVLHAAYWDRVVMKMYEHDLPPDFKYAGLVSGAGAIMDLNLITEKNSIPMFLFHGNGDRTVPYGTAAHHYCKTDASGWLMLFGSHSIYDHAIAKNASAELHTYCGGGHEYSGWLFEKEQQTIVDFIRKVMAGQKIQSHSIVKTGKKNELSSSYGFCD